MDTLAQADSAILMKRKQRQEMIQPYVFFMPAFILIAMISFIPLGYAIVQSFFRSDYLNLGSFVGFGNYYDYLISRNGLTSIINSIVFVVGTIIVAVPLGFGLALLLNQSFPFRGTIRTILILPWMVSNLVCGLLWAWLINPQLGLVTVFFNWISLDIPNFITNEYAAMASVILASGWAQYPLVMVFVLSALQTVSPELLEASRIDGATAWQRFWKVIFPLVRNTTMLSLILTTLHTFKNVEIILIMTGGGPNAKTETMALRVFQEGFQFFRLGVGSAGAVIIFILNIIFALAFIRILRSEHGA